MRMHDVLAFFGLVMPRIPPLDDAYQQPLRHAFRDHKQVMESSKRIANDIADRQANDPKLVELRAIKNQSISTIDALVREMQSRR